MRIKLLENYTHGIHNWKTGEEKTVKNSVGQMIVDEGKAVIIDPDDDCACGKKLVRTKKAKVWDDKPITRDNIQEVKKEVKDEATK